MSTEVRSVQRALQILRVMNERVSWTLQELHQRGRRVLMLGDGVNDVPVLAGADISVAMGSATDLAKTSADAVAYTAKS